MTQKTKAIEVVATVSNKFIVLIPADWDGDELEVTRAVAEELSSYCFNNEDAIEISVTPLSEGAVVVRSAIDLDLTDLEEGSE